MKKGKSIEKKSISNRVQVAFILIIVLISTGFIFSIYEKEITSEKFDEYKDINIKLSKLSVELSTNWGFFDMYTRTTNKDYINQYNASNARIEKIMKQVAPYANKDRDSSVYLRNLNNMFDSYKSQSNDLIVQIMNNKKLDENSYENLVELKTLFTYMNKQSELLVVAYINYSDEEYTDTVKKYKNSEIKIYVLVLCIILVSFILAMLISTDMGNTIGTLQRYAEELSKGKWEIDDLEDQKYEELDSLARTFNKMKNSIRKFINELNEKAEIENNYHIEKRKSAEKDKLIKETQLLALQAQMNPHFLFNTLNTISRMAMFESVDETIKLIEATSKIMRYNLDYKDRLVQLKEEILMTEAYITIQKTRFQEQMTFILKVDKELDYINVPPMLIQPIIENAIVHGLKEKDKGGVIETLVKRQENFASIIIRDNGIGIKKEKIDDLLGGKKNETTGIGVYNVKKRLELYYNRKDLFEIKSEIDRGTEITIFIPIEGGDYIAKTYDC